MKASERIALLALSSIVAASSAVVVLALDSFGIVALSSPPAPPPFVQASSKPAPAPAAQTTPAVSDAPRRPVPSLLEPPPTPMQVFGTAALVSPTQPVTEATTEEELSEWSSATTVLEPDPAPQRRLAGLPPERLPWQSTAPAVSPRRATLIERLAEISPAAGKRLEAKFKSTKASWPPAELGLVALKDQKTLELFARSQGGTWTFVHRYAVLAASGASGPKLRQGDHQVPEGVYGIAFLNPNSRYHLSMRVDYPNAFDREMAARDGRNNLGGDIMIHGKNASVGCLAIGDEAAEEIFLLAATVGTERIKVVIAPTDFRRGGVPPVPSGQPAWVPKLYADIAGAMTEFKAPPRNILLSLFGQ